MNTSAGDTPDERREYVLVSRAFGEWTLEFSPCGIHPGLFEFYGPYALRGAFVSPEIADRIFARGDTLRTIGDPRVVFAGLIQEWMY